MFRRSQTDLPDLFDLSDSASSESGSTNILLESQDGYFLDETNANYPFESTVSDSEWVDDDDITLHNLIIYWMNKLKFDVNPVGVCHGYTYMACLSFLGLGHLDQFYHRLNLIRDFHVKELVVDTLAEIVNLSETNEELPEAEKILLKDKQSDAVDILAFFNGIKLCQDDYQFPEIFPAIICDPSKIATFTSTPRIDEQGGLISNEQWNFTSAYSEDELFQFLAQLDRMAKNNAIDFCVLIKSNGHEVGLFYSTHSNHWYFIDANDVCESEHKIVPTCYENADACYNELWALKFQQQDYSSGSGYLLMESRFVTVGVNEAAMDKLYHKLANDPFVQWLHKLNNQKVAYESESNNLALLCAYSGNDDVLIAAINVIVNTDGLSNEQRNNLLQRFLNKTDHRNGTPIQIAACRGYANIVQVLCEEGVLMNIKDGQVCAQYATLYGHVGVLEVLERYGVNLYQPDDSGKTFLSLAKENKRTEVVNFLENRFKAKNRKPSSNSFFTLVQRFSFDEANEVSEVAFKKRKF